MAFLERMDDSAFELTEIMKSYAQHIVLHNNIAMASSNIEVPDSTQSTRVYLFMSTEAKLKANVNGDITRPESGQVARVRANVQPTAPFVVCSPKR